MEQLNCLRCAYRHEDNGNCVAVGGFCTAVPAANCRLLQEYLGTGLTPEEVTALQKDWSTLCTVIGECGGIERVKEMAEADKAGRVVVSPCKVGDTVYEVTNRKTISEYRVKEICVELFCTFIKWDVVAGFVDKSIFGVSVDEIGKTVFLTREEAKKALEARKDGDETDL